ncbi:beta/alpha barrel domain-containing protein [Pararhodonellum marinum]|uniref:bifunctional 4-hydroxy-2-oxoglutarate aldolase/2-dehydro-3-deoxy-phosphogluconate aldolase n=1 Tax=Pararhodonellum marinum TaxID=2755358 RepID=UPI00188FED23|nr:bifunctional 4-hydroxy-2-oxoglutarate aldolase/2-dehydro-3-deoxy-phosphogluconate aldolase [Pararhodonellum marinum]
MRFASDTILNAMTDTGLIPVFNHADLEIAKQVLDASYQAGIRVFEFTNRGPHSLKVFKGLVLYAEKYEDLVMGIGTIFTVQEAKDFLFAGADFIVSPALVLDVAHYCNMKNVLWIPGCATVTEVHQAHLLGAKLIKAYPGNLLGPGFISAIKAILPEVKLMPTGGVEPNEENLSAWFKSGVTCVGMGSQLFKKEWLAEKQFKPLEAKIKATLQIIQSL